MKKSKKIFRLVVLILALLTVPFACMGAGGLFMGLSSADFGFFSASVVIENDTNEVLYLTPITTTYAEPRVIVQMRSLRYKEFRLKPGGVQSLSYDMADSPLAGAVLCNQSGDCRLLEHNSQERQTISDFGALPGVDETWKAAVNAAPTYNFQILLMAGFVFTPLALFTLWWRLGDKKEDNED